MENLRWILLGAGVLILLGIWLSDRWAAKRREQRDAQSVLDREHDADHAPTLALDDDPLFAERPPLAEAPMRAERMDDEPEDSESLPPWRSDAPAAEPLEAHTPADEAKQDYAPIEETLLPEVQQSETPAPEPEPQPEEAPAREDPPEPVPTEELPEPLSQAPSPAAQTSEPDGYSGAVATGKELTAPQQLAIGAEQVQMGDDGVERVIALHVAARSGEQLPGASLKNIFMRRGYVMDDNGIFHWYYGGRPVFSVANMLEPGFFDRFQMERSNTPGIAMFARLPGPVKDDVTFDILLGEAYEIATTLGARLLDESRSTLTKQTMQHLRDSLISEQQKRLSAQRQSS